MKKMFGDYYIGLDMGTSSVGWAVTDINYNVQKINGKALWGIRLFDDANTASTMRTSRSARRRIERQTWRINLLQELFAEEITKVDPGFYLRLKESNLQEEDKSANNKVKYSLFTKEFLTDKEYYEKYPTIYHLRKALLENNSEAFDIRLLYLAIAHIIKHRGHFLFENLEFGSIEEFTTIYAELEQVIQENVPGLENWKCCDESKLKDILTNSMILVSEKKKQLERLFAADKENKKAAAAIAGFLSGGAGNIAELFSDETLKEAEKKSFSFKNDNFDDFAGELEQLLGERFEIIAKIKAVYDWGLLNDILQGEKYLSLAKVKVYNEHQEDLRVLKEYCRSLNDNRYKDIFGAEKINNYSHYVGSCLMGKGKKATLAKKCTQNDFCGFLKEIFSNKVDFGKLTEPVHDASSVEKLFWRIKLGRAFPKQVDKSNGVIPMQINREELQKILANAGIYYPFLEQKDDSGLSIADKILAIFQFRIPYYVGPLAGTTASREKKRCWVVRSRDKVYPWNFSSVVDAEASAEKFITNMTNKCTYLIGEDVLPKNSLLYTEFVARNELNNLAYDGKKLKIDVINSIYDNLLVLRKGKLSKKKIAEYLRVNNICPNADAKNISGVDDILQANLQSYKDFTKIFGKQFILNNKNVVEDIIRWITLFSDEKIMLKKQINKHYPEITEEQLRSICKLRYQGWGRLSKAFLDSDKITYVNEETGEITSLIAAMKNVNLNLMQLIHSERTQRDINNFNDALRGNTEKVTYETIDNMYISPAVKRGTWQTILIVQEIKKIMGHDPKRIFIEMAREEAEKKRTKSRKDRLMELYKNCKDEEQDIYKALEGETDESLRSNKLYLYYAQLGKCMYSGEKIDINSLYSKRNGVDVYDRDHIYPRSKTKDDSLDNLVLVHYLENREKTDSYPLKQEIQAKMKDFWRQLLGKGLISQTKYNRLVRTEPLSNDELAGFINRQLVETRQSTKAAAEILQLECPESEIVYSKAGNVSDFRQEFDLLKCRDVNDYHHAKDAYLNIVVGNAYHVRFTKNPCNFIENLQSDERYTLKTREFYQRDIRRGREIAWFAGEYGSIKTVKRNVAKNNILFTRMPVVEKGQIYDLQLLKKGKGQIPVKAGLDIAKYGGYNKATTAYFMLVKSEGKKGKTLKTLEAVPVYLAKSIEKDNIVLQTFLTGGLEQGGCGLKQPTILIKKIRRYSLMNIDGCMMHITGKTGKQITAALASQFIIDYKWEKYVKRISKFILRLQKNKNLQIREWDEITAAANIELYDFMLLKHESNAYINRPSSQIENLKKGREKFVKLQVEKQCEVLNQILNLFKCKPISADLKMIGGSGHAGVTLFNKDISAKRQVVLYNQSVTGVFEQSIDLLAL